MKASETKKLAERMGISYSKMDGSVYPKLKQLQAFGKAAAAEHLAARHALAKELGEVLDWARIEKAPLRAQEIQSIARILDSYGVDGCAPGTGAASESVSVPTAARQRPRDHGKAERDMQPNPGLHTLKPMATAPRLSDADRLLVVDEFTECGVVVRVWRLVYWLDAFDGRPAGWHGANCADLRNPVGWVCVLKGGDALLGARSEIGKAGEAGETNMRGMSGPQEPDRAALEYELIVDSHGLAQLQIDAGVPRSRVHVVFTGQSVSECRSKLLKYLDRLRAIPSDDVPGKAGSAVDIESYLAYLSAKAQPEGWRFGDGNCSVSYLKRAVPDLIF